MVLPINVIPLPAKIAPSLKQYVTLLADCALSGVTTAVHHARALGNVLKRGIRLIGGRDAGVVLQVELIVALETESLGVVLCAILDEWQA